MIFVSSNCNTVSTICSRTLGPAIAPSFVMCPIIIMGIDLSFAYLIKVSALYLVKTLPGIASISLWKIVCIESIIIKLGFTSSLVFIMELISVSL